MKRFPSLLAFAVLIPALLAVSTPAFSQSDAQKSFDKLKTLAGTWQATFDGKPMQATIRVTSMGNAIVHEMAGDSPEHPVTMIYLEGDRLLMTHYCDVGNRPRFEGKMSPDGKTLEFTLLDVGNLNSSQPGHMQHVVFAFVDANHHTEDWTFALNGKAPETGNLDFHRVN